MGLRFSLFAFLLLAAVIPNTVQAQTGAQAKAPATPPFEIVKDDMDAEFAADGRTYQEQTLVYRILTEQGAQALQQIQFSYTPEYETIEVKDPATVKKDGTVIRVDTNDILHGRGATSGTPGYNDIVTSTVVFPKLEVGGEISLKLIHIQIKPWFKNVYAFDMFFSPGVAVEESTISLTTPDALALKFDVVGLAADAPGQLGGKTRHVWHYHKDVADKIEADAVVDPQKEPHVSVGTLTDYGAVAAIYQETFRGKPDPSDDIKSLADSLTKGVGDPKQKARILYDWVSGHIRYVAIVLGAGGFIPHTADEVLKNGFGDCKDHVMLLEALLEAENIKSSPVLIQASTARYGLPNVPTPFGFNHLITYIPQFSLYVDSTAQYASFGVLPDADAARAVVIVDSGQTAKVPPANGSYVRADVHVTVHDDGSADGDSKITAAGTWAIAYRTLMAGIPPDKDEEFFHAVLGPGASGHLDHGDPTKLTDSYQFAAHFHIADFAHMPGPGALPAQIGYKPFSFTQLIGASLPDRRDSDYQCISGVAEQDVTVTLPDSVSPFSLPDSQTLSVDGVNYRQNFEMTGPHSLHSYTSVKLSHAGPVCQAGYYNKVHDGLARMARSLSAQVLYK